MTNDVAESLLRAWKGLPDIGKALSLNGPVVAVSGEDWITVKGFFPRLSAFAREAGGAWFLTDLEGRWTVFDGGESEEDYFQKLQTAPNSESGAPFPYSVQHQCFLGEGWVLISDRDAETMHLVIRRKPSHALLTLMLELVWPME